MRTKLNKKGAFTGIVVFFCLVGFCLQPWLTGAIIGIILAYNTKEKEPPLEVEIDGKMVEVTDKNYDEVEAAMKKAGDKERHERNMRSLDNIKSHYSWGTFTKDYDFKTYYETMWPAYPSLEKYLTPELKQLHGITDEWLKEREKRFFEVIESEGYKSKYNYVKRVNDEYEHWWDIAEPLITEDEFNKCKQEWLKMNSLEV